MTNQPDQRDSSSDRTLVACAKCGKGLPPVSDTTIWLREKPYCYECLGANVFTIAELAERLNRCEATMAFGFAVIEAESIAHQLGLNYHYFSKPPFTVPPQPAEGET